ncbi:DUF1522 domain-containing protein, partial [Bradyrhizobium sp. SRL28]|uniref:DUF1522 domain-containing protein n=1 Tax=Bradyrhizobium sp. SRL28 TaxID=2836178 RepID=UPI001BDDFDE1
TDLRGTTTYTSATALSNVLFDGTAGGVTAATGTTTLGGTAGTRAGSNVTDNSAAAITAATTIYGATGSLSTAATTQFGDGKSFTVNGKTISFKAGAAPTAATVPAGYGVLGNIASDGNGNSIIYLGATPATST